MGGHGRNYPLDPPLYVYIYINIYIYIYTVYIYIRHCVYIYIYGIYIYIQWRIQGANPAMAPHRNWQWSLAPFRDRKSYGSIVILLKSKDFRYCYHIYIYIYIYICHRIQGYISGWS